MTGCPHTADVGAFVLEALSPGDAAEFAEHVEGCATCRAEVERLQVVADSLPLAAPVVAPPPHLKGRIMAVVESEAALLRAAGAGADRVASAPPVRRHRSWWSGSMLGLRPALAALAATMLVAIGVGGGLLVAGPSGGGGQTTRVIQAEVELPRRLGARAELAISGRRGRLQTANFPLPPDGRVYQVWVERGANRPPEPTNALFTVDRQTGAGAVDVPADLRRVTKILVTAEPRGGSRVPTAPPVLSVTLS